MVVVVVFVYLVVAYLAIVYRAVLDCQWTNIQWCKPNPICLECAHKPYFPSSHRGVSHGVVSAAWHCSVKSIIAQVRLRKPRDGASGLKDGAQRNPIGKRTWDVS